MNSAWSLVEVRHDTFLWKVRHFLRWTVYPRFCETLAVAGRPLLLRGAEDMTERTGKRSCLVLAPHPDDETLGCAVTIMRKLTMGTQVHLVIATDGRHSQPRSRLPVEELINIREDEARKASSCLGLSLANVEFLRFEDGRLTESRSTLHGRLNSVLQTVSPDEVFVSSVLDAHPDHRVLATVARELIQSHNGPALYEYPVWFWDPLAWRHGRLRNLRVRTVKTQDFLARKHQAIAAYSSQVTNLTGESSWTTFRDGFLRQFLQPEEIFFEITGGIAPTGGC